MLNQTSNRKFKSSLKLDKHVWRKIEMNYYSNIFVYLKFTQTNDRIDICRRLMNIFDYYILNLYDLILQINIVTVTNLANKTSLV